MEYQVPDRSEVNHLLSYQEKVIEESNLQQSCANPRIWYSKLFYDYESLSWSKVYTIWLGDNKRRDWEEHNEIDDAILTALTE